MKRHLLFILTLILTAYALTARNVSLQFTDQPAEKVFGELMRQTGCNFSYNSSLLRDLRISVHVDNVSLESALSSMFADTGITYSIKGNNVTATNLNGFYVLHLAPGRHTVSVSYPGFSPLSATVNTSSTTRADFRLDESDTSRQLGEVTVEADRDRHLTLNNPGIGQITLTRDFIKSAPAMFGESDVIKSLQMQPGVSAGVEGLASMYVHGGTHDQNLYMLDNVPVYQVSHFGGLFSAFNTEAIKNVDFYKSSFPARYNGRLSSVMTVNTRDGNNREHHGSFRLGLTSGAFNIDGPIVKDRTTYSLAVRRSWFELLTVPGLAIYNSTRYEKEKTTVARYSFMDVNAKINHRFSDNSQLSAMFYFGDDYLKGGSRSSRSSDTDVIKQKKQSDISRLRWGNIAGSLSWKLQISPVLWSEVTASYSHFTSNLRNITTDFVKYNEDMFSDRRRSYQMSNSISDWSFRADFGFNPAAGHKITAGFSGTAHSFRPKNESTLLFDKSQLVSDISVIDRTNALEGAAYAGYDLQLSSSLRLQAGVNAGLFSASGTTRSHIDPRFSAVYHLGSTSRLKLGYSRTSQYVVQLTESALALPTDRWVPISGPLRPQRADQIAAGFYHGLPFGISLSAEIYYKWLHNLLDYRDDYYIMPDDTPWQNLLCSGSGRAKGLDLMLQRTYGRVTASLAYSLLWADRLFADKNGGRRFPSRFDNRHKINILVNWRLNDKWEFNAAWTGMSGNRISLSTQDYDLLPVPGLPAMGDPNFSGNISLPSSLNSHRLPFYHRLDLSANRYTSRGMWNFSLYNAYCNMNVIAIRHCDTYSYRRYEKFRLIPILPSVSYTWFF